MIINTIDELKTYLGGAVDKSDGILLSLGPYFDIAFDNHLSAWYSRATFDTLVIAHLADSKTPAETAFLPYIQAAIGWLGYYEYAGFSDTNFGDAGRYRRESEDRKGLYKYQLNTLNRKALANGYEALERMINFLEQNKTAQTQWPTEPGYAKYHAVFLNSASACREAHSKQIGRYVFDILRGQVEEIESFTIVKQLGQTSYDNLLTARETDTWTTEALEKSIIAQANKASLHFALQEGIRENLVKFDGNKVVQVEALEPQSMEKQGKAGPALTSNRLSHHSEFGNRHLDKLRELLTANIEDPALADYKAYQEALATALEEEKIALDNAEAAAAGSYSTNERCEPFGTVPGTSAPVTKGAIRL